MLHSEILLDQLPQTDLVELRMRSQALQILSQSGSENRKQAEYLLRRMHDHFHERIEKDEFFMHRKGSIEEQGNLDLQTCRGMLYYLMEELPYVPPSMHEQWFYTEYLMLKAATEAGERLLEEFELC